MTETTLPPIGHNRPTPTHEEVLIAALDFATMAQLRYDDEELVSQAEAWVYTTDENNMFLAVRSLCAVAMDIYPSKSRSTVGSALRDLRKLVLANQEKQPQNRRDAYAATREMDDIRMAIFSALQEELQRTGTLTIK